MIKKCFFLVSLLFSVVSFSQGVKIVDLPNLTTGFTNTYIPVTKAGTTYKASLDHFLSDTGNKTITANKWNFKNSIWIGENLASGMATDASTTTIGDWSGNGSLTQLVVDDGSQAVQSWGTLQILGKIGENDYETVNAQISTDGSVWFLSNPLLSQLGLSLDADGNITVTNNNNIGFNSNGTQIYIGDILNGNGTQVSINDFAKTIDFYATSGFTFNSHVDIAEAIDLYPSGQADFASGKTRFGSDGSGHLANYAIYWDSYGNLSNDNTGAWNISSGGGASFRDITSYYTNEDNIYNYLSLNSSGIVGTIDNNVGNVKNWSLGAGGLSYTYSEDGNDTYVSNWGIATDGTTTFTHINGWDLSLNNNFIGETGFTLGDSPYSLSMTYSEGVLRNIGGVKFDNDRVYTADGVIYSQGFSNRNSDDNENAWIRSSDGAFGFDNGGIYSDGAGNLTCHYISATGCYSGLVNVLTADGSNSVLDIRDGVIYDAY